MVSVAEDDIPVLVELDDDIIRLSASGHEIGQWRTDECEISHISDSTYTIKAEDETLNFVPSEPSLFAAAVNGGTPDVAVQIDLAVERAPGDETPPGDGVGEAPPPKPLTVGLFYGLCAVTIGFAIWSLISIVF